jgi:hypothetical protein
MLDDFARMKVVFPVRGQVVPHLLESLFGDGRQGQVRGGGAYTDREREPLWVAMAGWQGKLDSELPTTGALDLTTN